MDDLESLYFDTISLADSEAAAAVAAAHRKSLSQSRNTIYHSAVDLAGEDTPSKRRSIRSENGSKINVSALNNPSNRSTPYNLNYRHSSALEHYNNNNSNANDHNNGGGPGVIDQTDAAIAAQVLAMHNGGRNTGNSNSNSNNNNNNNSKSNSTPAHVNASDEVSKRLLQSSTNTSKDKKLPITYSQWKFRVNIINMQS